MKISIILPVYNEESNISRKSIEKILAYFEKKNKDFEIIIVDDGSADNTISIIKKKYLPNKKIHIIEKQHEGKAYSVIAGIKKATGDMIFFTDFDLATPIEEFDKLFEQYQNGYDIVIGSRSGMRKGAPIARKILSRGMMIVRDTIIGLKGIRDTQCGFKLFKGDAARKIITRFKVFNSAQKIQGPSVSAAFDLEFLYIGQKLKYKIKEVPVEWEHVESRRVNFLRDAYESMKDILRMRYYALLGKYN